MIAIWIAISFITLTIASTKMILQKNPISETPTEWTIKEWVVLTLAGGDTLDTLLSLCL